MESDQRNAGGTCEATQRIFISHSSKDKAAADSLVQELEAAGKPCWIAPRDIPSGADYRQSIMAAIDGAAAMVVLLSSHAVASPEVTREVRVAVGRRLKVVPVRLEVVVLSPELQYDLSILQWIDAHPGPFIDHVAKVAVALAGLQPPTAAPLASGAPAGRPLAVEVAAKREPYWEHRLSPALHFVGRRDALEQIRGFWDGRSRGVMAIVGMGGAGKTSMLEQFLHGLADGSLAAPDSLFGWSFYESTDSGALIESLCEYHEVARVAGQSPLHLLAALKRKLGGAGRHVLVLDGMERIQQEHKRGLGVRRAFGEVLDPLVRDLLRTVAGGIGKTVALVTSRFPLVDCQPWQGVGGFLAIPLDQLTEVEAIELLRSHGVRGSEQALRRLVQRHGRHALTLTHLAGIVARYFDGDAAAPLEGFPEDDGGDVATRRLTAVLAAYQSYLSAVELAVMQAATVFRNAVPAAELLDLVQRLNPPLAMGEIRGALDMLTRYHLLTKERDGSLNAHPAVRDCFYGSYGRAKEAHEARIDRLAPRLSALSGRPASSVVPSKDALDALEETVLQVHAAGRVAEALSIFRDRMGGGSLLARRGEANRGIRILEAIASQPSEADPDGYYELRRRVGEILDSSDELSWLTQGYAEESRLLLGQLRGLPFAAAKYLRGESCQHASGIDPSPRFPYLVLQGCSWTPRSSDMSVVVDQLGNVHFAPSDEDLTMIAENIGDRVRAQELQAMRVREQRARDAIVREYKLWNKFRKQVRRAVGASGLIAIYFDIADKEFVPWGRKYIEPVQVIVEDLLLEILGKDARNWRDAVAGIDKSVLQGQLDAGEECESQEILGAIAHGPSGRAEYWLPCLAWADELVDDWKKLLQLVDGAHAGAFVNSGAIQVHGQVARVALAWIEKLASPEVGLRLLGVARCAEIPVRLAELSKIQADLSGNDEEARRRLISMDGSNGGDRVAMSFYGLDDHITKALLDAELARGNRECPEAHLAQAKQLMALHSSVEHHCLVDLVAARVHLDAGRAAEGLACALQGQRTARSAKYRVFEVDLTGEVARAHLALADHAAALDTAGHAMALADDPVCGYVWGACYASAIMAYAKKALMPDSANHALADFQRRYAPLRGNKWFDAALARLANPL